MQFALIISGPAAPAPAPRIPAVPSITGIGLWDEAAREIWAVDPAALVAALPARLRRFCRNGAPNVWFDKRARIEGGRCRGGDLPRADIRNARGALVANVYLAPVSEESN